MRCSDDCSCKNYPCMMAASTPVCDYIQVEDQTYEKHCTCIPCEQNSIDDSDNSDRRKLFYHSC